MMTTTQTTQSKTTDGVGESRASEVVPKPSATRRADRQPAESAKFLDVQLEAFIFDIDVGLRALVSLDKKDQQQDQLREICRILRAAKLHFNEVLERYGADYEEFGQHLVDIAYAAADRAATLGFDGLYKSLDRHAKDIEKAQAKGKEKHSE